MQSAPALKPGHKKIISQLRSITFFDENKFDRDSLDRFSHYWHELGKEKRYFESQNFGGGSLMVWGAFSGLGKLELAFVSCRMTSQHYIKFFTGHLLQFRQRFQRIKFIF